MDAGVGSRYGDSLAMLDLVLLAVLLAVLAAPLPLWARIVLGVAILALIGFLAWLDRTNPRPTLLESFARDVHGSAGSLDRDPHGESEAN
jgi:hypothetical protein